MTEHLPECWVTDPSNPPAWCICFSLRACEARVREDERSRVLDAALHALYSMENMGGYPEFYFDHIRDDFRDVIDALKEKQ